MTIFKRSPVRNVYLLRPGEYMAVLNAETWSVYKCPDCGYATSISRDRHSVDYNGHVKPVVSCPHKTPLGETCKFTSVISLSDWVPEPKGSA